MPGAKEGHDERAETHEHPFEDDIRSFRGKFKQEREPTARLRNPHSTLTTGDDSPTPGGEANGVWNQAADPLNEMWDAIGQKQSSDELQQKYIPGDAEHAG
jgi:hypothetical protein